MFDALADLDVTVDSYDCTRRERETSSDFTRVTTVFELHGDGHTGRGEDVIYDADAHDALHAWDGTFPLAGDYTFAGFSEHLGELELLPDYDPETSAGDAAYRRWGLESAALDLALKQAGTNLGERLGRSYDPVRFVVSTRLGEPPTADRVLAWLDRDPTLAFKLDPVSAWTPELVERLADTGAVRVLDLKGQYEDTIVDQPADPELYERVLAAFPEAVIEDPALTEETRPLFADHEDRVAWDYPIRDVASVKALPWEPSWLNVKPSRFGSVADLLATIEHCEERGIRMYGGGQFELDVGRSHLHALASLFYPDAPNDIAPAGYNDPDPPDGLPSSPLAVPEGLVGMEWG